LSSPAAATRRTPAADTALKGSLLAVATLTVMAGSIVAPSLPGLERHFADVPRIEYLSKLIVTLPSLAMALMAPVAGYIIDRFGRRRLMLAGIVLYALAGLSGALIDSIIAILISRAILGVATATIATSVATLIGDYFEGTLRNRMAGYRNAANNLGGVVYLLFGGWLAAIDWRAPFLIYVSAFALFVLVWRHIYEPGRPGTKGASSSTLGDEGRAVPWLAIGANYAAAILFGLSFYMIPTQVPFLMEVLGLSDPQWAGLGIAASTLATGVTSLFYGTIRRFVSTSTMFIYGYALAASGYALVALSLGITTTFVGLIVFGIGMGSITANFSIRLLDLAPPRVRGRVMGGQNASLMMGFFASPFLSQTVADIWDIPAAFGVASGILATVMLGFLITAVLTPSRTTPLR